jgi:hypothetical protein
MYIPVLLYVGYFIASAQGPNLKSSLDTSSADIARVRPRVNSDPNKIMG